MPIPKLRFLNPVAGIPRMPLPLRYAVLITGLDVEIMCALLSGELHYPDADAVGIEPLLTAYELGQQASARQVAVTTVREISSQISLRTSARTRLRLIPKSFYVWSDELAQAFQHYIRLVPGQENAREWRLVLDWDPALGNYRPLIDECPNPVNHGSDASRVAAEVEKRNRNILAEYRQLKSSFPHLSKSAISNRIFKSRKYETNARARRVRRNLTSETIRRLINRYT